MPLWQRGPAGRPATGIPEKWRPPEPRSRGPVGRPASRFGAPINRLGLVMAYPEIESLRDLVGEKRALEILLEGRIFGAEEAQDMGIVTRVVDDDAVEAEAYATAERIADGAPLVARWHKKFLKRLRSAEPLSEAEFDEGFACYGTEDFGIGYRAFLAKEKPDFKGR